MKMEIVGLHNFEFELDGEKFKMDASFDEEKRKLDIYLTKYPKISHIDIKFTITKEGEFINE